jgi:hypothetical protein
MTPTAAIERTKTWPQDPYKGLAYYGVGDVPLFAGRDDDITIVSSTIGLSNVRILLLHGMTGCGKSSFLRAGLIPTLETEVAGYKFLRDKDEVPSFVPSTGNPTASLARTVHQFIVREYMGIGRQAGDSEKIDNEQFLREIASKTEPDFLGAVEEDTRILVRTIEQLASYRPRTLVLVIDQAEEVITLKPGPDGEDARIQFFDFLGDLSRSPQDFKLIIAFRTEYHGQFYAQLRYGADVSRIADYYLADFTRDQIVEAILRPTSLDKKLGYSESPYDHYGFEYEKGLPGQIAEALLSSGVSEGVLPALQIVCRRLYEGERAKATRALKPVEQSQLKSPASSASSSDHEATSVPLPVVKFKINARAFTDLGGVAGQVNSYLQGQLEAAVRSLSSSWSIRKHSNIMEIVRWRKVLGLLVKPQPNGTFTTDVVAVDKLKDEAYKQRCVISPELMLGELANDKRRILRPRPVTNLKTREVIPCYSLGHDVLASALQSWYERDKQERKMLRNARWVYGLLAVPWIVVWYLQGHNLHHKGYLIVAGISLMILLLTFVPSFRALLVQVLADQDTIRKSTTHEDGRPGQASSVKR